MRPVIHLRTGMFDISAEPDDPINSIAGVSLLDWLRGKLPAGVTMSASEPEDWGWFAYIHWHDGRKYMIGACAVESLDADREWIVQADKQRSLKEKLLGREKLTPDDSCFSFIKQAIHQAGNSSRATIPRRVAPNGNLTSVNAPWDK